MHNKLKHIAIILDGNKRWAKKNNISLKKAYKIGLQNIESTIKSSLKINLPYLTLFTLSSENIQRKSINNIFEVIYDDFAYFIENIIKEKKVNVNIIGSKKKLPNKIIDLIIYCEDKTKFNNNLYLNLAFNYGFKDEIKKVLTQFLKKNIDVDNENKIRELFYLGHLPDPDLLIRTGGEKRLSNFIMYNLIYTEIFFINSLWPEFKEEQLLQIIDNYMKINRRYGL